MRNLKWLELNDVLRSIPAMEKYGVSKVARGITPSTQTDEGWVQAYIATGGNPVAMAQRLTGRNDHESWMDRRKQFLARHLKKAKKDNEPLWRNGEPTRRHLALVAWGYSPTISRLKKWLETQPTLSSGEWKNGVRIIKNNPISRKNTALGYQSYGWTTQDWRSIFLHQNNRISYDQKCGAEGTRLPSGKPRLCLPLYVIQKLMKTKKGKEILITQSRKKQRAKKGQRVAWHPKIKELHAKLEKNTPKDIPRKNPHSLTQFFIDRNIRASMLGDTLMVQIDPKSRDFLEHHAEYLGVRVHPIGLSNHYHITSSDWQSTYQGLQNIFH